MTDLLDSHLSSDAEVTRRHSHIRLAGVCISDDDVILPGRLFESARATARSLFGVSWRGVGPSAGEQARVLQRLEDDWDGHSALAPDRGVVEWAASLLDRLPSGMPIPDVSPSTDGGVILEWDRSGAEVLLVLRRTGPIEALIELDGVVTEGTLETAESEFIAALVRIAANS